MTKSEIMRAQHGTLRARRAGYFEGAAMDADGDSYRKPVERLSTRELRGKLCDPQHVWCAACPNYKDGTCNYGKEYIRRMQHAQPSATA